jgi:hypothetical protein
VAAGREKRRNSDRYRVGEPLSNKPIASKSCPIRL